jgi:GNAT superfamily N-acetyltransferase
MAALTTKALDTGTWDDFARLVEQNNGVWGGCWCMGFHPDGFGQSVEENKTTKLARVRADEAHAALVYDGADCVGWCQFGPTAELPRIKRKKAYQQVPVEPPDWRITCFFVGKGHRGQGVASAALGGALHEIGRLGGGIVESFPENVEGRKTSGSFLHNATVSMFERHGFARVRQLGKHHWLMTMTVPALS